MTRVVVDADYLVYATGFAVERVLYDVMVERPDGSTEQALFRYKDEVDAWLSDECAGTESTVDTMVEADPLSHALFLIDRMLTSVDSKLSELGVDFDRLELFLTGKENFRNTLATIKGYKANRKDSRKPIHYKGIRRYLRNRWGAEVIEGYEADDKVAMLAHQYGYDPERLLIVSMDKDLRTVPGGHFHFKRRTIEVLSENDALVNFYRQLITGDTVDNIGGCYRAGEKAAQTAILPGMTETAMYDAALDLYRKSLEKKGCPYVHLSAEAALLENARLLHMLRYENDVWLPPGNRPQNGAPGSSAS